MDVVRRIARSEGPRGFFRGLPPTLVGILPSRSVYFWAYGTTKAALGPISPSTDLTHMGAAVVAGMTANTITNPVWLLKTRMQLQAGALSAAAAGTAAGTATEAATGVAAGAAAVGGGGGGGVVADAAAAAGRPPPSAAAVVVAARVAGGPTPAVGGLRVYAGYGDAIRTVYREEGIRGFYRGLTASYWGVTEGALHFLLYERLKRAAVARNYARAQREVAAGAADGIGGDDDDEDDDEEDPLTNPAYALSSMQLVSSAALAKLVASMVTYPHETVRTRMREQPPIPGVRSRYHAMFPSLRLIAMEEGRRGLYAGMGTHLLRVVPSTAIMFLTFETAVRWLERQQQQRQQQQ